MHPDYPFNTDDRGRTALTNETDHVRDMIEQVLFTAPGERVNRPDFGSGLLNLIFAPNSPEIAATTQFLVQGALQQWLGDVIEVHDVMVESFDSTIRVEVAYRIKRTGAIESSIFTRSE